MQGVKMKKFLVQIWAFNYHAKFEILAEASAESIEKSVLDKLGEKRVKWDYLGEKTLDPRVKRITYEEVNDDPRPIQYEEVLGTRVATRAPLKTSMEGDFDTGNVRYKARERYVFGFSDPRGAFGSDI